jgi:hypothetical protein
MPSRTKSRNPRRIAEKQSTPIASIFATRRQLRELIRQLKEQGLKLDEEKIFNSSRP